jgi:hypothetical protein
MSHFNLKSLAFYGLAIGSVVLLFKGVSSYGETKLKAPPKIEGRYRIEAQNLPGCLKSDALVLNIQQSGIYLFGSLLPASLKGQQVTIAEEKPSLTGLFKPQQLSLEGSAAELPSCNNSAKPTTSESANLVKIEGQVIDATFNGKITHSSLPEAVEFTAQREESAQQTGNH